MKILAAAVSIFVATHLTADAQSFRRILISTERGIDESSWKLTPRDLKLRTKEIWSVRKLTLRGGKQDGVDLVIVNNGKMTLTIVPTRGMGIAKVEMGDVKLGWDSPVKEIVHPQFVNLQSRGGLGWLEGFNEWLVRCGLEFAGHPGKDKFINNVGEEAEMDLTLHGKIGNIPASEVTVLIDRDPPNRIRVRGRVDERMFYGPKLELWTEISTEPGSSSFRIEDRLTNRGTYDQEFELIYHLNHGPPLLGPGAEFVGAVKQVTPFNATAAKALDTFQVYDAPTKGFIEQVYCLTLFGNAANQSTVLLRNPAKDRALAIDFSLAELPYFTLWKNSNVAEEGYVTGLEPGTSFPYNRRVERSFGRVPKLGPGETRNFTLNFTVLATAAEVTRAADEIRKLQASPPKVDRDPPQLPR